MCFFVGVHRKSGSVFWQLFGVFFVCGFLEWKRICCYFNLFVFQANSTGCFLPPKHGRLCMLGWWFQAFLDFLALEKSFHLTNIFL